MLVKDTPAIRLGRIDYNDKVYKGDKAVAYDRQVGIVWDDNLDTAIRKRYLGWVYLIVVNGIIYKIGQSSAKSGINGTLSFYMSAGFDDPGQNRFVINALIRRELDKGHIVEFYGLYQEPVMVEVQGFFTTTHEEMISAKGLETACVSDYLSVEGEYPVWNYQEAGIPVPNDLALLFGEYKTKRANA